MLALIKTSPDYWDRIGVGVVGLLGSFIASRQAINSVRKGEVKGRYQSVPTYRQYNPIAFWFHVFVLFIIAVAAIVLAALAFGLLDH
jgi:hypothetical protein